MKLLALSDFFRLRIQDIEFALHIAPNRSHEAHLMLVIRKERILFATEDRVILSRRYVARQLQQRQATLRHHLKMPTS